MDAEIINIVQQMGNQNEDDYLLTVQWTFVEGNISYHISFRFEQSTRTQAEYRPTVERSPSNGPSLVLSVMINHKLA